MTLEELEERIMVIEDIEAIKNLHSNYVYALSNQQWDNMLDYFTEDAVCYIKPWGLCKGKKEIEELFKNNLMDKPLPTHGHLVEHPVMRVGGNWAMCHWSLYLLFDEPERRWIRGEYTCEYAKVDGSWKMDYVNVKCPWPPLSAL